MVVKVPCSFELIVMQTFPRSYLTLWTVPLRTGVTCGETAQVFDRLRWNVIKVDNVSDGVQQREEEGSQRADLVERNVRVQWNVLLDGELFHFGQEIPRHGQQQETVAEREGSSRSSRNGDSDAHDVAQIRVFGQERVVDEAVDEQGDCDDVEEEKVEDVLAVLLQESRQFVPSAQPRMSVAFLHGVDVETGHTGHVRRSVEEILFGSFAI